MRILAVLTLFGLFGTRVLLEIRSLSATYDEPYFVAAGYATLKTGDFRLRKDKPILSPYLLAMPLLFSDAIFSPQDPNWLASDQRQAGTSKGRYSVINFSLNFLFRNNITADQILLRSRLSSLAFAILLGGLVYSLSKRFYDDWAGLFSLALFSLCPNILAHAGLATEDMILSTFYFSCFYVLWGLIEKPSLKAGACLGLSVGAAIMSKFTGLLVLPTIFVLVIFFIVKKSNCHDLWKPIALALVSCASLIAVCYRFVHIPEYFGALNVARAYISAGQPTYFAGNYTLHGPWYYFLFSFLVKTPIPTLLAFIAPLTFVRYKSDIKPVFLILPVALLMIAASFTPMKIGHRHILPIYPFLFVLAGDLMTKERWRKVALFLVLPWLAVESIMIQPRSISYFNELIGGPQTDGIISLIQISIGDRI